MRQVRLAVAVVAAGALGGVRDARGEAERWAPPSALLRPAACGVAASHANRWDEVRDPGRRAYCAALARGDAALARQPAVARDAAAEAERASPGQAASRVLAARAHVALGEGEAASAAFDEALALDPHAADEPVVAVDLARARAARGQGAEALAWYRRASAGLDDDASPVLRLQCLVEAAAVASSLGAPRIGEAVGLLRAARATSLHAARPGIDALLALALDRAGAADESADRLRDAGRGGGTRGLEPWQPCAAVPGAQDDAAAAAALARERTDRAGAMGAWRAWLATRGAQSPWREHASARLAALVRGAGRR